MSDTVNGAPPEVPVEPEAVEVSSGDPSAVIIVKEAAVAPLLSVEVLTPPSPLFMIMARLSIGESAPEGDDTRWMNSVTS